MFVIGMDSKVGEKYLGLGDEGAAVGDEHTWNGMEWDDGANSEEWSGGGGGGGKKVKEKRDEVRKKL